MPEPVSLAELKAFSRIDHDDEDTLVESLGVAAREFIETATGRDYSSTEAEVPERAKTAIMALVAHWYEYREPASVGQAHQLPFHLRAMVHQLRDWSEPADEETAA